MAGIDRTQDQDWVDLVATAFSVWDCGLGPVATRLVGGDSLATPDEVAEELGRLVGRAGGDGWRPVRFFDPLDVVQACELADRAGAAATAGWGTTAAARAVGAVRRAAAARLAEGAPGWVRPAVSVVGIACGPGPAPLPGVEWVGPEEGARRWLDGYLVVVTAAAAFRLPPGLPDRRRVYVVVEDDDELARLAACERWHGGAAVVVCGPDCAEALEDLEASGVPAMARPG